MTVGDWINLSLSILSFVLAALSIIIVVISIRQNNKMIESQSRPYISVYGATTNYSEPEFFIVLKNFGASAGLIIGVDCDIDLSQFSIIDDNIPLDHLNGHTLAPRQNIVCCISKKKLDEQKVEVINFHIKYSWGRKTYLEEFQINYLFLKRNVTVRFNTKEKELKTISYVLQDIGQKDL